MGVLEKLPTFLTVCVLVMIFACLKRHTRCARLTLWAIGWTLVFTHFLAQLLQPVGGHALVFLQAVDSGALQCSAVAFLVSVSSVAEDKAKRTILLLALAVPSVSYAVLDASGVQSRWAYILCLSAAFGGAACFAAWMKMRFSLYLGTVTLLCSGAFTWALFGVLQGSFHEGTVVLLSIGFAVPGIFMCRNHWKASPAVLTISAGFFCWAAVFPFVLSDHFAQGIPYPGALWDTPKLFVAFGMILAVVEDKSQAIVGMEHRAGALHRQLERFSALSSRLLTSAAPETICPDIASAITELTRFPAALIHVDSPEGTLHIAGCSGLTEESFRTLQERTKQWTATHIKNFCANARRIGNSSFLLPAGECSLGIMQSRPNTEAFSTCASELLIPLFSASGACLGSIAVAAPGDEAVLSMEELARIESIAADLAVAVELKSLHKQLVCSEKLAAVGQLVAGVAHELNNPLTAIMGFGELISDTVTSGSTGDQLKRLMSETRRMKRITDNLLRFSRQSSAEASVAHLASVVQEVLTLCEYYTRNLKICIAAEIAPDLPVLAISEDEIKQVLLNLFNNSCDALQDCTGNRTINLRAYHDRSRVVIQVEDNGPGFSNLSRALDPFYTTKPAGKGTGLGLSICCGIAKRRGGDLRIENVEPHGGRVTLEIPILELVARPMLVASAHA